MNTDRFYTYQFTTISKVCLILILWHLFFENSFYGQYKKVNFDNYSVEDGLSHNFIHCVFQDSKGWIWLGTSLGIERFDGIRFKAYSLNKDSSSQEEELVVRSFYESKKGEIYVCFEEYGIGVYNREYDIFEPLKVAGRVIIPDISVKDIDEDNGGNLWVATKKGLHKINLLTGKVESFIHDVSNENSLQHDYIRKLAIDSTGKIWIGTMAGLDLLDTTNNKFIHLSKNNPVLKDEIWEIFIDKEQKVWVGTYHNGMAIIDPVNYSVKKFELDKTNERSLTVRAILQDKKNNFWIGTRGGLYFYNSFEGKIILYTNNSFENNSLVHNSVLHIMEDFKGDLWIGTRGGLSHIVKEKQGFIHYKAIPNNKNYLNNGETYCFWIDNNNNIWIGTESGGINILNRKTGTFEYITESGNGLSNNCVKSIVPDGKGNILIGTFQGGLNVYNLYSKKITKYLHNPDLKNGISGNIVWAIVKDKNGKIWIGTENGLDLFNIQSGSFEHINVSDIYKGISWLGLDSENDLWLGSENLKIYRYGFGIISSFKEKGRSFFEDSKGRYWISTENKGFALYDKYKGPIKYYNEESGLPSNLTICILEDNNHKLWISTANGLSRFDPVNEKFKNFDKLDGLQGNQFVYGAAYKSENGELLFGGTNGFNIFNPDNIIDNTYIPPVYITNFRIFNQPYEKWYREKSLSKGSVLEKDYLEIPYKYNVISFDFVTLNYANSKKNKYKYILEGFDNNWTETIDQRSATYTNLNPGEYVFKVMGTNGNDYWNPEEDKLVIKILPPYYKTWWFKILIFLTIIFLISLLFMFFVKRKNLQNALVFEKEKAKKLHELDLLKFRFFTNISHEIKTPLTLIISPLEKMLKIDMPKEEIKKNLVVMQRNANQLLNLVIQLLDFRKLEAGKLRLELKKGDIVRFVKDVLSSFLPVLEEKKIKYRFKSVQDEIITLFDADKLEKIINNLVLNSIKYTENEGSISVFLSIVIDDDDEFEKMSGKFVKFEVKDSGIGIPEKNINNIFNRFYRSSDSNIEYPGSGIGLSFTKELVQLHNGKIYFESKPGQGTVFTVLLPYKEEPYEKSVHVAVEQKTIIEETVTEEDEYLNKNKKILLIVEDNHDVRSFLKTHFEKEFEIQEAENGKAGVDIAIRTIPDVIISDIMMPVMNGNELCEKLKKDERTSHIPIVLLTALSSKENVMEGLVKGADDYITKPFDVLLLQTKIENLLHIRKALREKYSNELVLKPSSIIVTSPDERFLQKAIKIVEKYIDDPDLDIEKFVAQTGISRMQLYRKMAALTNMTVKEFINDIRLKRAAQLIQDSKLTISEVAYSVGFNDISYFGKCFRKKFGMSATEFASQREK